ncbi:SH3 domain-containing protein [Sphingomonas sp. BGYR3]|uniref:SH3 domain-containing protein n=1 Tax=Sphingomonas sp. BGYR3 TaxID=2975483 RepID=UPI0021A4E740|nr:SH3 domain-containing protein [Sphingomonas sp. BGYR3]MDG5487101.1 SH3 domain-containing protein [Sphingomonas sp. BGYR3]
MAAAMVAALTLSAGVAQAQRRETPYYASIAAQEARMRTGPGQNYPASWLYVRRNLPVRVVAIYKDWRKVEDPGGTQGWVFSSLLSASRTAMVTADVAELRASASTAARVSWRAQRGVVGKVSKCRGSWCYLDVNGRGGFVEQAKLWGVDPGETF